MKAKWLLVILLLVVLPVAFLSFLAARTIRHQESIFAYDIRRSAQQAIAAVDAAIQDKLHNHLDAVALKLAAWLQPGSDAVQLRVNARRIARDDELADTVFVFMNPWGFLYDGSADEGVPGHEGDVLADRLRGAVAAADSLLGPVVFRLHDAVHLFQGVPGSSSVWIGYRVSDAALAGLLGECVRDRRSRDLVLSAEGPWVEAQEGLGPDPSIVISDSFGPVDTPPVDSGPDADGRIVATASLRPPLESVRLTASVPDLPRFRRITAMRRRLLAWATLLAATSVIVGVVIVLNRSIVEIRHARHRGEFLLGVSHDLRTPLASMRMLAESLCEGRVREKEQQHFLQTIVSECDRLSRLIERVLYLVRYGQGALVFCERRVSVGDVVQRAVSAMRTPAHSLQLRVDPDVPYVRGDESALQQVVMNLLDNAVKYGGEPDGSAAAASEGGPRVHVEITIDTVRRRARRRALNRQWVRIAVKDFGIGMSREEQRRVFDRFYRSARAQDRNVSGVGLGLSLCRHVVRGHGGWITIDSAVGQGSLFTVYLPAFSGELG